MMRRILTFLLVALMLANQGLCFAHVHGESGVSDPASHDSRTHFHWGGHGHHKHHHRHQHDHADSPHDRSPSAPQSATSSDDSPPLGHHDSDAVYGGEWVTLARVLAKVLPDDSRVVASAAVEFEHPCDPLPLARSSKIQPSFFGNDDCPIYLRALSLRL